MWHTETSARRSGLQRRAFDSSGPPPQIPNEEVRLSNTLVFNSTKYVWGVLGTQARSLVLILVVLEDTKTGQIRKFANTSRFRLVLSCCRNGLSPELFQLLLNFEF